MKRILVLALLAIAGTARANPPTTKTGDLAANGNITATGTIKQAGNQVASLASGPIALTGPTISLQACVSAGQTWVWNGSGYACGAVSAGVTTVAPLSGTTVLSLLYGSGLTLSGSNLVVDTSVIMPLANISGTTGDLGMFSGTHAIGNFPGSNCGAAHAAATSIGVNGGLGCSIFVDTAGTGLSLSTSTLSLANTAVTAGSYTYAGITVDAQGRLTAASSGTAPATGTGTSSTDTRWTGTSTLGNSSSTDDGTTKTLASLNWTPCTDTTTGGVVTITPATNCTRLVLTPSASRLDIVGFTHPSASGPRHITVVNRGTQEAWIYPLDGTAASADQIEGTIIGSLGGWPINPHFTFELDYDPTNSKWEVSVTNDLGNVTANGTLAVTGLATIGSGLYAGGGYISSVFPSWDCGLGTSTTATCYINGLGYNESTGFARSLEISNGTGHGTTHQLLFADGINTAVDLLNSAVTFTTSLATLTTDTSLGRHLRTSDSAITTSNVSSCGASPAVQSGSTDLSGAITFGAGGTTSCQITFNHAYSTTAPICTCSSMGASGAGAFGSCTASTTVLSVVAAGGTSAFKGSWICTGGN